MGKPSDDAIGSPGNPPYLAVLFGRPFFSAFHTLSHN